jgi:hypothetical protein
MAPTSPIISGLLGTTTASGKRLTFSDFLSAYTGDPSNLFWVGVLVLGGILIVKKM